MKKDKKSETPQDTLVYMKEDLRVFRTPKGEYYIIDAKQTFRSELYKDLEHAVNQVIGMKKKIY